MTSGIPDRSAGGRQWLRAVSLGLLVVAVCLGTVVVAARGLGWQVGPLYFLVALTPYVGLAMLVVASVTAMLRAWWLLAFPLALALIVGFWWRPALPASDSQSWDLQVMTVNMQFGRADPAAIVRSVRDHSVDVMSVQELTPAAAAGLRAAGLEQTLPYRMVRAGDGSPASGTGIWSRYPLSDEDETEGLIFHNLVATVTVNPDLAFSFFAMHPIPPSPMDGTRGADIFAATRHFMNSRPGPAVAAGDFNATRDNVPIRNLQSDGWVDAIGVWPMAIRTWPNDLRPLPPLIAIDHVLTRQAPVSSQVTVIDIPGTDHRALVATV